MATLLNKLSLGFNLVPNYASRLLGRVCFISGLSENSKNTDAPIPGVTEGNIKYRVLKPSDQNEIRNLYATCMPECVGWQSLDATYKDLSALADIFLPKVLPLGLSYGAFDVTHNNLVGYLLAYVTNKSAIDSFYLNEDNMGNNLVLGFVVQKRLSDRVKKIDLFNYMEEGVFFSGLSVHPGYRHGQVATVICQEITNLALRHGHKMMFTEVATGYSEKLLVRLGYRVMDRRREHDVLMARIEPQRN